MSRTHNSTSRDDHANAHPNQSATTESAPGSITDHSGGRSQRPGKVHLIATLATGIVLGGAAFVSLGRDQSARPSQSPDAGQATAARSADSADITHYETSWTPADGEIVNATGTVDLAVDTVQPMRTGDRVTNPDPVETFYLISTEEQGWAIQKILGEGDAIRVSLGVPPLPPAIFVTVGDEEINGLTQSLIDALQQRGIRVLDARTP